MNKMFKKNKNKLIYKIKFKYLNHFVNSMI